MIRTYILKHGINAEKQEQILQVLRAYRVMCKAIANVQWRMFFTGDGFNKMADIKPIKSELSERYKRNCCYQVEGALQGFIANRQNDFIDIVYGYNFDKETRKHLLQINRRRLWFKKSNDNFTAQELWLAHKIFKGVLSKHRKPRFGKSNMLLNQNVAKIKTADKAKTIGFDYWIKFSTLQKGKPIELPVRSNKYFDGAGGKLMQAIQINERDGEITIAFMKDIPAKTIAFKTDLVSIDIGLKNLFALKNGDLFGRDFYGRLKHFDAIISNLAANRQRQRFKTKSARYNLLIQRLRNFLKNEINRCLNRIVKLYAPKKIVIERLNFQNANLSKRLNRILQNFGKGQITKKLQSLQDEYSIEFQEINPAYTSQQCPNEVCGYVDKNNRKTQEKFSCKCCGYTRNADVVGARNHAARSSDSKLSNIYLNKKQVLQTLVVRFLERHPRRHSSAHGLLSGNPYFKGHLEQPKQVA